MPFTTEEIREALARHTPALVAREPGHAEAAVALVLAGEGSELSLCAIRRAEHPLDPWSGHMALPGGRSEPGDADLVETAVRETFEEVGLPLARADLLGGLDDVVPRTPVLPPIAVRPFVFGLAARPVLTPNPEVAGVRWVHLDHLLHPETYHSARLEIRGEPRDFPAYRVDESIVWGMTERILTGLLGQLRV